MCKNYNTIIVKMELKKGERVYIRNSGNFANIVKTGGILGIKNSYAALDDDGNRLVFMGKSSEFAFTGTGETPSGEKVELPLDGFTLITECGLVGKGKTKALVKTYNALDQEGKASFCERWCKLSDDEKLKLIGGNVKPKGKTRKEKTSIPKK